MCQCLEQVRQQGVIHKSEDDLELKLMEEVNLRLQRIVGNHFSLHKNPVYLLSG